MGRGSLEATRTISYMLRLWERTLSGCTNSPSIRSYSQMTDLLAANGVPPVRQGRKVTIFSPARTAMQSGSAQTLQGGAPNWRVAVEVEGKWSNPLIGWTSTADHIETVTRQLYFPTKEAAIAWAENSGMDYEIEEPAEVVKSRPKRFPGYGSNFDVQRLKGGKPVGGLRSERKPSSK